MRNMEPTMLDHLISVQPVSSPQADGWRWAAYLAPYINSNMPYVLGVTPSAAVFGLARMLPHFEAGGIPPEVELMAQEDGAILWRTRDGDKVVWVSVDGVERRTTSTAFIELLPAAPRG